MQREVALLVGVGAIVLLSGLVVVAVPGVIAEPTTEPTRPDQVGLQDLAVSHGTPTGETVPLSVTARLEHRGSDAENVTVRFTAIDANSGLVETERTVDVGTLRGDRETAVPANLTVARQGGYRIQVVVYQDGQRRSSGGTSVEGVGTLTPAFATTDVQFHRFEGAGVTLPTIEYQIDDSTGETATLNVSTYLTNAGDEPSDDVRLVLKARQVDSNILAAERTVRVGGIAPGQTARPSAGLSVPTEYNYYLDAVLWTDGVIVGSARSAANLDPSERITVNETRRDVGLDVGDFEQDDGGSGAGGADGRDAGGRPEAARTTTAAGPGFGPALAVLAVLGTALTLVRRRDSND